MKNTLRLLFLLLAMAIVTAEASGPSLTKEDVIKLSQERLANIDWSRDAIYDVRRGVGNMLGSWLVVISCTTCLGDGTEADDLIVLTVDRSGKVLCQAIVGEHICAYDNIGGAVTSQDFRITNPQGNTIKIRESYQSGGGRSISISVHKKKDRRMQ